MYTDVQMDRSDPTTPTVKVSDIKEHLNFLTAVEKSLPNAGNTLTAENVHRYEKLWLPLVSKHEDLILIPPLDIAFMWHVHRLAPLQYSKFCKQHFHKILNSNTFSFQTNNKQPTLLLSNESKIEPPAQVRTRLLWKEATNDAPFFCPVSSKSVPNVTLLVGDYDVAAAAKRQTSFGNTISSPLYHSDEFLLCSIQQYKKFLLLVKESRRRGYLPCVPSVSIDLVWHTHQLLSTTKYLQETSTIMGGRPLNHDDNLEAKQTTEDTQQQWESTQELWFDMFGKNMTYEHVNHIPMSIENFVTQEFAKTILQSLPHEGNLEAVNGWKFNARKTSVTVPLSFRDRVKNAMFTTKVVDTDSDADEPITSPLTMSIPCRIKSGHAPPHQDRFEGGEEIVDALVAMVYLKGSGTLQFENIETSAIHKIAVQPYSLIFFQNSQWIHQVVPNDKDTRVMLGPFTFTGDELVRAGDCGGCGSGCGSKDGSCLQKEWGKDPCTDRSMICGFGLLTVCCCYCIPTFFGLCYYETKTLPEYKKKVAENEKYFKQRAAQLVGRSNNNTYNLKKQAESKQQQQHQEPTVQVQVPPGMFAGDTIIVVVNEVKLSVVVPIGLRPGMMFMVVPPVPSIDLEKNEQALSVVVVPTAGDWSEMLDPASGYPYWYNSRTGVSSWENPNAPAAVVTQNRVNATKLRKENSIIVDRSGTEYQMQRPIPKVTELMLKGIESVDVKNCVDRLRVILSTIGSARIEELFYKYDVNNSGGLDAQEFKKLAKRLTMSKPTSEQLDELQNFMFADVAAGELALESIKTKVFGNDTWLVRAFEKADIDHSATLDRDECHSFVIKLMKEVEAACDDACNAIVDACMQKKKTITLQELRDYIIRDRDISMETLLITNTTNKEKKK